MLPHTVSDVPTAVLSLVWQCVSWQHRRVQVHLQAVSDGSSPSLTISADHGRGLTIEEAQHALLHTFMRSLAGLSDSITFRTRRLGTLETFFVSTQECKVSAQPRKCSGFDIVINGLLSCTHARHGQRWVACFKAAWSRV